MQIRVPGLIQSVERVYVTIFAMSRRQATSAPMWPGRRGGVATAGEVKTMEERVTEFERLKFAPPAAAASTSPSSASLLEAAAAAFSFRNACLVSFSFFLQSCR